MHVVDGVKGSVPSTIKVCSGFIYAFRENESWRAERPRGFVLEPRKRLTWGINATSVVPVFDAIFRGRRGGEREFRYDHMLTDADTTPWNCTQRQ